MHATANITLRTYGIMNARSVAQTSQGEVRTRLPLIGGTGAKKQFNWSNGTR